MLGCEQMEEARKMTAGLSLGFVGQENVGVCSMARASEGRSLKRGPVLTIQHRNRTDGIGMKEGWFCDQRKV